MQVRGGEKHLGLQRGEGGISYYTAFLGLSVGVVHAIARWRCGLEMRAKDAIVVGNDLAAEVVVRYCSIACLEDGVVVVDD